MPATAPLALPPGFVDPVLDSQSVFRTLLEAMSYPGRVVGTGAGLSVPAPVSPAAAAACLTLADYETPLWLDTEAAPAREWLRFHCGSPVEIGRAHVCTPVHNAQLVCRILLEKK